MNCNCAIASIIALVLLSGCRDIDRVLTDGQIDGFAIGSSKRDAFSRAKTLYVKDSIAWLSPQIDSVSSLDSYGVNVFEPTHVESTAQAFRDFQWWMIENVPNLGLKSVSISFEFGSTNIDMIVVSPFKGVSKQVQAWPENTSGSRLSVGMSYEQAFLVLEELSNRPRYESVLLRAKDQRKIRRFDHWDYSFMESWDDWQVVYPGHGNGVDMLELSFKEDILVKAHRIRRPEFMPY